MEEALGLKQPEKPVEAEAEEEYSEADLKRILRRKLVFERRARGDTIEEIVSFCQKNGYPVTERTIFRDLRSEEVCSLIDELVRIQFRDIAMLRGYHSRRYHKNLHLNLFSSFSNKFYIRFNLVIVLQPCEVNVATLEAPEVLFDRTDCYG